MLVKSLPAETKAPSTTPPPVGATTAPTPEPTPGSTVAATAGTTVATTAAQTAENTVAATEGAPMTRKLTECELVLGRQRQQRQQQQRWLVFLLHVMFVHVFLLADESPLDWPVQASFLLVAELHIIFFQCRMFQPSPPPRHRPRPKNAFNQTEGFGGWVLFLVEDGVTVESPKVHVQDCAENPEDIAVGAAWVVNRIGEQSEITSVRAHGTG